MGQNMTSFNYYVCKSLLIKRINKLQSRQNPARIPPQSRQNMGFI